MSLVNTTVTYHVGQITSLSISMETFFQRRTRHAMVKALKLVKTRKRKAYTLVNIMCFHHVNLVFK